MNPRTRIPRQSRRAMAPGIDHLESRQLLSTILKPVHGAALAHHHEALRLHHAAEVGRGHSTHHGKAVGGATPETSTGFRVVAQFTNASFHATTAIAEDDIWAVGNSTASGTAEPFAAHFNGTSWSAVPTPTISGSSSEFSGVAAVASNDVWAVGEQVINNTGKTLIENWNGTSWSVVPSPSPSGLGDLTSVTAVASNNVWAAGSGSGSSGDLVEHWNGTNWSIVSSPAFSSTDTGLRGISADASNDVWAVGFNSGGSAAILHFNGTSWSRVASPTFGQGYSHPEAVTALSPTDVWLSGTAKQGNRCCPFGLVEHFDGTSWSEVTPPNPEPGSSHFLAGIAASSANDIWAVGVFIDNWNGTSWSIVTNPIPDSGLLAGVTAFSDGTAVAVGTGGNSSDETVGLILQN